MDQYGAEFLEKLREIIKENDASNRSRVFSTYKNKAEIGKLILDTLIAKKYSRKQIKL